MTRECDHCHREIVAPENHSDYDPIWDTNYSRVRIAGKLMHLHGECRDEIEQQSVLENELCKETDVHFELAKGESCPWGCGFVAE